MRTLGMNEAFASCIGRMLGLESRHCNIGNRLLTHCHRVFFPCNKGKRKTRLHQYDDCFFLRNFWFQNVSEFFVYVCCRHLLIGSKSA